VLDAPADVAHARRAACRAGSRPAWSTPDWPTLPWGQVDARAGAAAAACIDGGARWVRQGTGLAIVTAPIHKEALAAAGVPFPGHTEMLLAAAGARAGAHDAGQRRTARGAGDHPPVAARAIDA
jgi:4-hydroxythreonine-4-phosphate dehydrogenase